MKSIIKFVTAMLFAIAAGALFAGVLGISPLGPIGILAFASIIVPVTPGIASFAATISVSEIVSEFGTFIGQSEAQILRLLTQPIESTKYMSVKATKEGSYKMSKAVIGSIVQGFQKAWTPTGTPTFTPRTILQRRHKFDMAFYPDEIVDSWLGFLSDESIDRKAWPISRYILEQLILPKVAEDRELRLLGKGVYEEPEEDAAQAVGKSMDGFVTQLEDAYDDGGSNINFIALDGGMTALNVFENIEDFAAKIDPLYQYNNMRIFCSRGIYMAYHKRRRDLYGTMPTYNPANDIIEGTNLILTPLPSMTGKDVIFATPMDNFVRLLNRNDGASNIQVESVDRQVKIWADWHENVGFGIEEAVFAYVPTSEDELSASI